MLKKPKKPFGPPVEPSDEETEIIDLTSLFVVGDIINIENFADKVKEKCKCENIKITIKEEPHCFGTNDYGDDNYLYCPQIKVIKITNKDKQDKKYKQELETYQVNLALYNKKMEIYNEQQKLYEEYKEKMKTLNSSLTAL